MFLLEYFKGHKKWFWNVSPDPEADNIKLLRTPPSTYVPIIRPFTIERTADTGIDEGNKQSIGTKAL
ncbi:predicted protein [Lichtheimia corymbifera JMRC:FSU:9682]|uniref:Uncharacterized protein n=1 Tax=Lichtheimia corymbifera JMRC:FSU:9682 TaxID=1263082 RepID=A0A068S071_9FUNG|nr:predicted protein [Lichtheimia corymbifera JMRC:FSU:9682]